MLIRSRQPALKFVSSNGNEIPRGCASSVYMPRRDNISTTTSFKPDTPEHLPDVPLNTIDTVLLSFEQILLIIGPTVSPLASVLK